MMGWFLGDWVEGVSGAVADSLFAGDWCVIRRCLFGLERMCWSWLILTPGAFVGGLNEARVSFEIEHGCSDSGDIDTTVSPLVYLNLDTGMQCSHS